MPKKLEDETLRLKKRWLRATDRQYARWLLAGGHPWIRKKLDECANRLLGKDTETGEG